MGRNAGPLVFKPVGKPIFFIHTSIAPKYWKAGEEMDTPRYLVA